MIQIPIEIGDVIRVGKFKNKRITVKDITWDEYGLPQVNGKGIMKIRIEKLMPPKEPKQEIAEQVGKQSIKFIGFRKNNDGKIVEYVESITQDLGKEFKGPVIKFGYLNQFTGLRGSKEKGWFRVNKSTIRWEKYGVIWEEGTIQLDIKQDIQENNMKLRENKPTNFSNQIGSYTGIRSDIVQKFLDDNKINHQALLYAIGGNKIKISDVRSAISGLPGNRFAKSLISKFPLKESFKPNKAKLDRMIFEALHSNDTQVKITQKDKLWWICQTETDECLNTVGFDSKEAAEHSALTKGYSFSGQEEINEMEPEVLTSKKEKVKGIDKVETMKLDKEKEIKLEILRIAKRVIKEELKKKIGLNELEVNDPSIVAKIEEMAKLSDEIDRMANEMAKLKKQFAPLDEEITKLMEETAKTGDRAIETKTILITIKKEGYEAKSPKYKESFEKLYAKVNATMKKQADEILAANTSMKKYSTTLAVQYKKTENRINEGMFSDLLNKVKSYFSGLYSKIVNLGKQADVEINNLKRLSSL